MKVKLIIVFNFHEIQKLFLLLIRIRYLVRKRNSYISFYLGDDGEVFQIKRSHQSKKIRKQIDKEREEKKRKDSPKTESSEDGKGTKRRDKIITTDDQVTIKIKNPIVSIFNSQYIYHLFALYHSIFSGGTSGTRTNPKWSKCRNG